MKMGRESLPDQEKIRMLERATELVERAKDIVDEVVSGTTKESYYKAYGRFGFNRLLGEGNPYDEGLSELADFLSRKGKYKK